jgi:polar amino acid transport system ATP-binding protein
MIEVHNLSKSFGQLEVLKKIDVKVSEKEVVVLIGASGSGKSTLLRCLNFLEVAERGEITIDSEKVNLAKTDLNKVREKVGMVFQHFNLFPIKPY